MDSPTIGCFASGITVTIQYHASFQMHCMSTVTRTLLYDQFIVSVMPSQEWEETEPPGRGQGELPPVSLMKLNSVNNPFGSFPCS